MPASAVRLSSAVTIQDACWLLACRPTLCSTQLPGSTRPANQRHAPLQAGLIHRRSRLRHRVRGLAEAILTNQALPFQAVVLWLASSSPTCFVC